MPSKSRVLYNGIYNSLATLAANNLTVFHHNPIIENASGVTVITWPNHISGDHNSPQHFTRLYQYRMILQTEAFTCLLFDGSIIRASYKLLGEQLVAHNLLWWPAPFPIEPGDLELGGILDIFDLYASVGWMDNIRMRTPVRFDFDAGEPDEYPLIHLHMQDADCRLHVDRPICFNRFIKFIFQNYYPEVYAEHAFLKDLKEIPLEIQSDRTPVDNSAYLGWVERGRLALSLQI